MMNNSLAVNLLLTGLVSRIASYPQPLLRSFLLSNSLVFQTNIKSLVQVETSPNSSLHRPLVDLLLNCLRSTSGSDVCEAQD